MNLWIKIFLAAVIVYSCYPVFGQGCKATLKIISDIEKVNIFLNDSLSGSGADFQVKIKPGIYKIKVEEITNRWDAKIFNDTVQLVDCSEKILNYSFRNKLILDTDPQNVYVFHNDSLIGYTPLLINQNYGLLRLQKPDYKTREIKLSDLSGEQKVKLDFIGEEKTESFFESTLFKILVGTAISLGASAAYFKLEADKKFDEYKITGDPELLNQTDRFDLISGVSFVALQINFGMIIYFFLSE